MPRGIQSGLSTTRFAVSADPAAGNEWSITVPAGKWWILLAVTVANVQGAADTPTPILVVDDGTNVLFESPGSSAAQASSTTTRYTWAPGYTLSGQVGSGANVRSFSPIPMDFPIPPGGRIRSSTIGITANANYGIALATVVEYG